MREEDNKILEEKPDDISKVSEKSSEVALDNDHSNSNLTLRIVLILAIALLVTFIVLAMELLNKRIFSDLGLRDPTDTLEIAYQLDENAYDAVRFLSSVTLTQESTDLENELKYRNSLRNYKIRAFELQHFQTKVLFYLNLFLVLSSSLMALFMIQSPSKEVVKVAGNEYSGRSIGVVLLLVVFIYYSLFVKEVYQPDELWYITNIELMNGQYVPPGREEATNADDDNE